MRRAPGLLVCVLAVGVVMGLCDTANPQPRPRRESVIEVDEIAPVIDSVDCPPEVIPQPTFSWIFTIQAHDEAPLPWLVTPENLLEYSYVFFRPAPLPPIYSSPEFSRFHRSLQVSVDGQSFPGEYTYACRVRDQAGNISEEWTCRFAVSR
jgi:hypothetical protein